MEIWPDNTNTVQSVADLSALCPPYMLEQFLSLRLVPSGQWGAIYGHDEFTMSVQVNSGLSAQGKDGQMFSYAM